MVNFFCFFFVGGVGGAGGRVGHLIKTLYKFADFFCFGAKRREKIENLLTAPVNVGSVKSLGTFL